MTALSSPTWLTPRGAMSNLVGRYARLSVRTRRRRRLACGSSDCTIGRASFSAAREPNAVGRGGSWLAKTPSAKEPGPGTRSSAGFVGQDRRWVDALAAMVGRDKLRKLPPLGPVAVKSVLRRLDDGLCPAIVRPRHSPIQVLLLQHSVASALREPALEAVLQRHVASRPRVFVRRGLSPRRSISTRGDDARLDPLTGYGTRWSAMFSNVSLGHAESQPACRSASLPVSCDEIATMRPEKPACLRPRTAVSPFSSSRS